MKITNNQLKYIKSLHQTKFRQMYENFMAEGDKLVLQLLLSHRFDIELLVANKSWIENHYHLVKKLEGKLVEAENHQLQQITTLKTATDVIAVLKKSKAEVKIHLIKTGFYFYLDGVQDPGNAGTIIRIADWFGFKGVIRSEDSVDFYNSKVVQATMGSIANVELITLTRLDLLGLDCNVIAADMNGQSIRKLGEVKPSIIVLGKEGSGVSDEILNFNKTKVVSIPGYEKTLAESLNVSVAAGILAYEIMNQ